MFEFNEFTADEWTTLFPEAPRGSNGEMPHAAYGQDSVVVVDGNGVTVEQFHPEGHCLGVWVLRVSDFDYAMRLATTKLSDPVRTDELQTLGFEEVG